MPDVPGKRPAHINTNLTGQDQDFLDAEALLDFGAFGKVERSIHKDFSSH